MTWYKKEQATPFDTTPLSGLYFLDGDWLATRLLLDWTKGEKCPMLVFPSGFECEVWDSGDPANPTIHITGELDLPLHDTCEVAYQKATRLAEQVGYVIRQVNPCQMAFATTEGYLLLTYDDLTRTLVNVEPVLRSRERPRPPLLDVEVREKLPPLRSQEHLVFEAIAHVKFVAPGSHWIWYASEASYYLKDGGTASLQERSPQDPDIEDVIFFGLVNGDFLEYGSFSLSELERGLGFAVERDRSFTPRTLRTLQEYHERERKEF